MSRAAHVAVACEAMNGFRLVPDLHQVGDEGLHLRCHRLRYSDVDARSSRHRHETKPGIAVGVEGTRLWQNRSRNALAPHWTTLNYSWRCSEIIRANAVTAKLSDRADCRVGVRPCIGWSREHATEHERDSASVLAFHVTCLLFLLFIRKRPVMEACGPTSPCESATVNVWMPAAAKR